MMNYKLKGDDVMGETSIPVSVYTKNELDKLKESDEESYEDLFTRLLVYLENDEQTIRYFLDKEIEKPSWKGNLTEIFYFPFFVLMASGDINVKIKEMNRYVWIHRCCLSFCFFSWNSWNLSLYFPCSSNNHFIDFSSFINIW